MFRKILIANRGEIALRIIRACKELDIRAVAIFASIDENGLWIREADEAHELQGFAGRDGYLSVEAILDIARKAGVDAIHPGYGFLSEQSRFAKACHDAGFAFIGPSPGALGAAGDKVMARKIAADCGIPVLKGTPPLSDAEQALHAAREIGFPLLLKAAAGGGGRGMRLITKPEHLREAFQSASREAVSSFGDGSLYFEKYMERPRHLEIQVMADNHGHACYLGERECSIQRRYQKLIEESPSPAMDENLRSRMGECALRFIREIGYTNAGTVEFLLDEKKQFYFLEMNARIQVEHPVTEMVTGIDLVKTQILVAKGEKLPWRQDEIKMNGWAFEARVNCEDPSKGFLPSPGRVTDIRLPGGPGIRVDTALYAGYEIPPQFDSLVAKLLAWGKNREEAISRIKRAIREFELRGIPTTLPFHLQIFSNPAFARGELSTHFLEEHLRKVRQDATEEEMEMAAVAAVLEAQSRSSARKPAKQGTSAWGLAGRMENLRRNR